jgi:hypothetical protein
VKHVAICDVCRLLRGDLTYKMCSYCSLCDSEICEYHNQIWNPIVLADRASAKVLRMMEKRRGVSA